MDNWVSGPAKADLETALEHERAANKPLRWAYHRASDRAFEAEKRLRGLRAALEALVTELEKGGSTSELDAASRIQQVFDDHA